MKNAQGAAVVGADISIATAGTGLVTLAPASGKTDTNGKFTTTVSGVSGKVGSVTLTASAVGSTAQTTVTVSPSLTSFGISQSVLYLGGVTAQSGVPNPTTVAMTTADTLTVTAAVPVANTPGTVTFATSMGWWGTSAASSVMDVPVASGVASVSADLHTASAGVASVQALVKGVTPPISDSLTVSMTAVIPNQITLQASPSTVSKSFGTTTGVSSLIATVTDSLGQPVGNAAVAFSILNPTGGGEIVSPVVAYTTSIAGGGYTLGQAIASFTSGSLTSGAGGVQVRAQVIGTSVATCSLPTVCTTNGSISGPPVPSGPDAFININGTAGSVAFGSATVLAVNGNATNYIEAMSVIVADSSGAPIKGAVVNLSLWPIAWSTGSSCRYDADFDSTHGTFLNEDANENLVLDSATTEDGTRLYYATGTTGSSWCSPDPSPATTCTVIPVTSAAGTPDQRITPPNSAAGTLTSTNPLDAPGTVTTNSSGVGTFNLEYGKNNAIWTVVRIRAKTTVAGTDAVGEIKFRLGALQADGNPCILPPSPYTF